MAPSAAINERTVKAREKHIERKLSKYWLDEGERIARTNYTGQVEYVAWHFHEETREVYDALQQYAYEVAVLVGYFGDPVPEGQTNKIKQREKQLRQFGYDPYKLRTVIGI